MQPIRTSLRTHPIYLMVNCCSNCVMISGLSYCSNCARHGYKNSRFLFPWKMIGFKEWKMIGWLVCSFVLGWTELNWIKSSVISKSGRFLGVRFVLGWTELNWIIWRLDSLASLSFLFFIFSFQRWWWWLFDRIWL